VAVPVAGTERIHYGTAAAEIDFGFESRYPVTRNRAADTVGLGVVGFEN